VAAPKLQQERVEFIKNTLDKVEPKLMEIVARVK
jgi:hypothetical protein